MGVLRRKTNILYQMVREIFTGEILFDSDLSRLTNFRKRREKIFQAEETV